MLCTFASFVRPRAASALTGLLVLALAPSLARAAARVGQPAPAFTLNDVDGKPHSLAADQGKIVVLEWFNYDCPFTRKHYDSGNMQALQKKYTGKGIVWLSINSSAPGKQGNYPADKMKQLAAARGAAPTAVLLDPDGAVGMSYGAKTTPHMFVVDRTGVLVYDGAIDDRPSTDQADVQGARNYVALALDELLAGKPVSTASTTPYGCSVKYK
ncbi:MAG TPA: thioredoxin family protein [Candidatus Bathyarchaeia archaeon]|nr:thioredoxin family protein [Candidatus Bathyarchaeia archaeon]